MRDDTKKVEESVVEATDENQESVVEATDENEEAVAESPVENEESVVEATDENEESVYDWAGSVIFDKKDVVIAEKEESLYDWVNSVIAEYEIRFEAWIVGNSDSPALCIKAIRGDKVSGTAYLNVATPHRRSLRTAIQTIIKEVIQP